MILVDALLSSLTPTLFQVCLCRNAPHLRLLMLPTECLCASSSSWYSHTLLAFNWDNAIISLFLPFIHFQHILHYASLLLFKITVIDIATILNFLSVIPVESLSLRLLQKRFHTDNRSASRSQAPFGTTVHFFWGNFIYLIVFYYDPLTSSLILNFLCIISATLKLPIYLFLLVLPSCTYEEISDVFLKIFWVLITGNLRLLLLRYDCFSRWTSYL